MEDLNSYIDLCDTTIPSLNRKRKSLSLFDIEFKVQASPEESKSTEYEESLMKEIRDWTNLLKAKIEQIEKIESEKVVIDETVLNDEQIAYLKGGPNFKGFVQDSEKYTSKAMFYLEQNEYCVEARQQYEEICKNILDKVAFEVIYDSIYTNSKV